MSSTQKPRSTRAAAIAVNSLPPDMQYELRRAGFSPMRIEDSGALCFCLRNELPVKEKEAKLNQFRQAARQYGLDLQRIAIGQSWAQPFDDGILLVAQPVNGRSAPLFASNGVALDGAAANLAAERDAGARFPTTRERQR